MRASLSKQTVTVVYKDPKSWDEQAVRDAIEKNTNFEVGKILN